MTAAFSDLTVLPDSMGHSGPKLSERIHRFQRRLISKAGKLANLRVEIGN